jgi:flagellar motor switch protein FliN/FliY
MTHPHEANVNGHDGAANGAAPVRGALVNHVDVQVETYLGATSMTIAELNALTSGSVVTLEAALNTLVELRVNGVTFATGELVAVGDKFGVRIVSVSP